MADYLALCRNPRKDLKRWLAEDKKRPGATGRGVRSPLTKGDDHAYTNRASVVVAKDERFRRQPLPDRCEYGWTRTGAEGGKLTVCLLDREPVLADMTGCDKFELREPA